MDVKIKGRVVIVTGPNSSGKDGIVRKITESNPSSNRIVIPYDGAQEKRHFNKRPKFGSKEPTRFTCQLEKDLPMLVNCNNIRVNDIETMIMQIRMTGYTGAIELIKINLDILRHTKYCQNNKKKRISLNTMMRSREDYQPILDKQFEDFNLSEIVVSNPGRVRFSFE